MAAIFPLLPHSRPRQALSRQLRVFPNRYSKWRLRSKSAARSRRRLCDFERNGLRMIQVGKVLVESLHFVKLPALFNILLEHEGFGRLRDAFLDRLRLAHNFAGCNTAVAVCPLEADAGK